MQPSNNTPQPRAPRARGVFPPGLPGFAAAALAITLVFATGGCGKKEHTPPANQPLSSEVYSYAVLEQPALLKEFEDSQRLSESLQAALDKMKTEIEKTGQKADSVESYRKQSASLQMINARLADIRTKLIADYGTAMRNDTIPADLQEKLQQMETDAARAAQKKQQPKAAPGKAGQQQQQPPEPLVIKPSGGLPATVGETDKSKNQNVIKPSGK